MKLDLGVFREYDIRGVWEKNIDRDFSFTLGVAFSKYLRKKLNKDEISVSIGYDARLSSKEIFDALSKGFNSQGAKVFDIGLVPTPVQYFSLFNLDVDGGVMITASHNPKEYNGFKLSLGRETLFGKEIREVGELMQTLDVKFDNNVEPNIEKVDMLGKYIDFMLDQFGYLKDVEDKPSIALDGGNGTAGFVGFEIFKRLGFDVKGLFIEPDGNFPNHHPDPTVEKNLKDLKETIEKYKLEFGVGYDGDGDRIGVVLKDKTVLWGDQLLLLLSQDLCKRKKGAKVIMDVKCSDVVYNMIEKTGCKPIMYKTGHSLIKNKMKEEGALLAGEMSGHIFMGENYFGYDDAVYVSLKLAEIVTRDKLDLVSWKNSLPKVYNTPEIRIDCPEDKKGYVIEEFESILNKRKEELGIVDTLTIDGVRFKTDYGWGLVRASNTQPVLVLRFEANSGENLERIKDFTLKQIEELIKR